MDRWQDWIMDYEPDVTPAFGGDGEVISLITRASAEKSRIAAGTRVTAGVESIVLPVLAG